MVEKALFVPGWEVLGIRTASCFFSAVSRLFPLPVHFCFEGDSIAEDIRALLDAHAVSPTCEIHRGTVWPRARIVHVSATEDFVRQLAVLAEQHAGPEICDHLHAYRGSQLLMQWYDAFDDPILIDGSISEEALRQFCREACGRYAPYEVPPMKGPR